jgi:hypothetical protein
VLSVASKTCTQFSPVANIFIFSSFLRVGAPLKTPRPSQSATYAVTRSTVMISNCLSDEFTYATVMAGLPFCSGQLAAGGTVGCKKIKKRVNRAKLCRCWGKHGDDLLVVLTVGVFDLSL